MAIKELNPYLNFNGTGAEAIALYTSALGAKVENMMRYADMPGNKPQPENAQRILHAQLRVGQAVILLSDVPADRPTALGGNVQVTLQFDGDLADMTARFNALAAGGQVTMPLQDTFWGATFGMLTDRFGVQWMFNSMKPGA